MLARLIEILFFVIVILSLIRMIVRMLIPFLFQHVVNKAQQQSTSNRQYNRKPEGSIHVDYIPPQKGSTPIDKAGDFIDYEEIK
jgi:hypothetical protein